MTFKKESKTMKQKEEKLNVIEITCEYVAPSSKKKYTEELELVQVAQTKSYKMFEEYNQWNDTSIRILVDISKKKFAWVKNGKSIAELTKRPVKYEESLEALLTKFYESEILDKDESFTSFKVSKMNLKACKVVSTLEVNSIASSDLITADLSNENPNDWDYLNDVMSELESMKEPKQKKTAKKAS